jgi:hypothetical protein
MTVRRKVPIDILKLWSDLPDDAFVDDAQYARLLGRSPSTVKRLRREGKIKATMVHGRPLHRVGDIRSDLREMRRTPAKD